VLVPEDEPEKELLAFGKVSTDGFVLDFEYPFSALQAFALALSSFS
jgi:tubby-related protein 1